MSMAYASYYICDVGSIIDVMLWTKVDDNVVMCRVGITINGIFIHGSVMLLLHEP